MCFIVWGKKRTWDYRGGAAEFCPFCRRVQLHGIRDVRVAGHIYGVAVGKGQEVEQECSCIGCFHRFAVPPSTYRSFVDDPDTDPLDLMRRTDPDRLNQLSERLALEERLGGASQRLTRDERMALIAEPLYVLNARYKQWTSGESRTVSGALLSLAVTCILFSAFLVTGVILDQPGRPMPMKAWILLGLTAVSLPGTVHLAATRARRFARRHIMPLLVKALSPVQPTRAELDDMIQMLGGQGLLIGQKLRPEWVVEALHTSQIRCSASEN